MGALCRHPPPCSMRLSTDINEAGGIAQPFDLLVEGVHVKDQQHCIDQQAHKNCTTCCFWIAWGSTHHPIEVKSEVGVVYHASAHATFGACAFQNIRICTTLTRAHLTLLLFNNI